MSRLTELLRQARKADPQLGKDLEVEITALTKRGNFGLVFEQHQPEAVELPGRAIRRGDKVRVRHVAADIVDPHGYHLSNALPKLRGLADFAEKCGTKFRRIESVAKAGDTLKVLDLTKHHVRHAVRGACDAWSLSESELAGKY